MTKLLSLALALCITVTLQAAPDLEAIDTPKPDFEIIFSDAPVEGGRLTFIIRNSTGADAQVLLIPHLERQKADGSWEEVPFLERVGFCGMADPLPAGDRVCVIEPFELWGVLESGVYRLSYEIMDTAGTKTTATGEFTWETQLQICGLPPAEG